MLSQIQKQSNIIETAVLVGMLIGIAAYFGATMQLETVEVINQAISVSGSLG